MSGPYPSLIIWRGDLGFSSLLPSLPSSESSVQPRLQTTELGGLGEA